jgi:hypothetical protein
VMAQIQVPAPTYPHTHEKRTKTRLVIMWLCGKLGKYDFDFEPDAHGA